MTVCFLSKAKNIESKYKTRDATTKVYTNVIALVRTKQDATEKISKTSTKGNNFQYPKGLISNEETFKGSEVGSETLEDARNNAERVKRVLESTTNEVCTIESVKNSVICYSNTSQEKKNSQVKIDGIAQSDHTKQSKFEPIDGLDYLSGTPKDLNGVRIIYEGKQLDKSKSSNDSW